MKAVQRHCRNHWTICVLSQSLRVLKILLSLTWTTAEMQCSFFYAHRIKAKVNCSQWNSSLLPDFTIELRTKGKHKQNSTGHIPFSSLLALLNSTSSPGLSLILVNKDNKDTMLVLSYLTYISCLLLHTDVKQINLLKPSDVLLILC